MTDPSDNSAVYRSTHREAALTSPKDADLSDLHEPTTMSTNSVAAPTQQQQQHRARILYLVQRREETHDPRVRGLEDAAVARRRPLQNLGHEGGDCDEATGLVSLSRD